MTFADKIGISIFIVLMIGIGWFGNDFYREIYNLRNVDGLWIPKDNLTESQAETMAKSYDSVGDWICVNIKGMSIDVLQETINHEVGHEIFARYCEKNIEKCKEVVK